MDEKLRKLSAILSEMGSVLVAYSGGIDSALVAQVAHQALGDRAIALTAISPSYPSYELIETKRVVAEIGMRHLIINTNELDNELYRANQGNRCYFCKTELFEVCWSQARKLGIGVVVDGFNQDDLGDVRPGTAAKREQGVRSPLLEAGLGKVEIRRLAKELGLSIWDKPALACLSSRFPVGVEVTPERLARIDALESGLKGLGFKVFRVRFHEPIARLELDPAEISRLTDPIIREQVVQLGQQQGFAHVTVDLAGYQMGGANRSQHPLASVVDRSMVLPAYLDR